MRKHTINLLAIVGAALLIYTLAMALFGERAVPTVNAQTDRFLESRLNQMEQRFYALESRLTRIETSQRTTTTSPLIGQDNSLELQYVRSQVDALRLRLGEVECGLLRVDERTLTAHQRRGTATTEPCRRDWGQPVTLSTRSR
jgi:hypothetical protein